MQFWGNDDFAHGVTVYGTHPDLYLSLVPWSSSPEGVTGLSLRAIPADLFDGYQFSAGAASGRAAFAAQGSPSNAAGWSVSRRTIAQDVEVAASPQLSSSGALDAESFVQFGVCACVGGGTLTTPGADAALEHRVGVSGYFLVEGKAAATNHRLVLLELSSGSITELASQLVSEIDDAQIGASPLDGFAPRPLRLTVTPGAGSSVELHAYRVDLSGVERLAFGGGITRGSGLAAGRAGFGAQVAHTTGSGAVPVVLVDRFSIRSADGSTTHFVDEFRRSTRRAARTHSDLRVAGASLASAWTGDGKSRQASSSILTAKTFRRGGTSGVAGAGLTAGAGSWPGFFLRQTPEETPSQRYAATLNRANSETGIRTEQGILFRFTASPFPSGLIDVRGRFPANGERADYYKVGYAVAVVYDAGAWTLEVRHFDGTEAQNHEATLLATADLSSFTLALGVDFDLDVEIRNFDGDSFGLGEFVAIVVKIDTVAVTPVPAAVPGVLEDENVLIDTRSAATGGAGAVGLYLSPDALAASDIMLVKGFEARVLTDPPRLDPAEQVTLQISAESASKSGSLTLPMDAQVTERIISGDRILRFESGAISTMRNSGRNRRSWSISATLVESEWTALVALFAANGAHAAFDLTFPAYGLGTVAVYFNSDEISLRSRSSVAGVTTYEVSFDVVELLTSRSYNRA